MSDNTITVIVGDSFEIKAGRPGSDHAPGIVVVFDGAGCSGLVPSPGFTIELHKPSGAVSELAIDEGKVHGSAQSFFFKGLHKADVPIGSRLTWSQHRSEWRRSTRQTVAT